MIPAWHIGLLALLYAIEYIIRSVTIKERKYIYIGKAFSRGILAVVYFYFAFVPTDAEIRSQWIRLSLTIFLSIDLFFAFQERIMGKYLK